MIAGLAQLFFWQVLGEIISKFLCPSIPGPVVGLLCLLISLVFAGRVNAPVAQVSATLRQHMGLLFVPAAVGVVLFLPEIKQHIVAFAVTLLVSLILTIAATGLVLKYLWKE